MLHRPRILLLPLLVAAAVGSAVAGTRGGGNEPRWQAADTVAVYGPKRFEAGRGAAAMHVERFAASPGAAFVLRVVDGDGRGNGRVSALSLRVNGAEVATAAALARSGGTLDVPVLLLAQNTIEATVEGPQGAGVSVVVLQVPEPSFTAFGPHTARRAAGAPSVDTESFALPPGAAAPYRLQVTNGAADGSGRTSSATIRVNGVQVVGPADLSQNVGALLRDVQLGARNTVEVELRGAPGSHLTYRVTAMDTAAPHITLTAPAAELVTREAQVEVAGTVEDATPVSVTVNGTAAARSGTGFRATVALAAEGANILEVSATDAAGNRTDSVRTVTRDTEAPVVTIVSPAEGEAVKDTVVEVRGTLADRTAVQANVNGVRVTPDATGAFAVRVPVTEGTNFLTLSATDAAGNAASAVRQVVLDTRAPELAVTAPAEGLATRESSVVVTGTAKDASAVTVTVNGVAATLAEGAFRAEVPLAADGPVTLAIVATDAAGNAAQAERRIVRDTQAPTLTLAAPSEGMVTRESSVALSGRVEDATALTLTLGGAPVAVGADGGFTATAALAADGPAALALVATDAAGNRTELVRNVVRDTQVPALELASPTDGIVVREDAAAVTGRVADATTVSITVNGAPATLAADGSFQASIALAEGETPVVVIATDAAGNESRAALRIVRDSQAPVITVATPAEGSTTEDERVTLSGTVTDATAVTLTLNGGAVEVGANGGFSIEKPLVTGANSFAFEARDAAGNTASLTRTVTREEDDTGLPPDPSRVASAIDPTVATSLGRSAAFLYTGASPIQTGVAPGTIVEHRTAVLRGRVLTREGRPLSGARVTVRGHPEYGSTLSRRDGAYDLVVNGGTTAVLDFDKDGYLPAQRATPTVWMEFAMLPDVALVALDSRVTGVALTAGTTEAQVARGSIVSDADGPRQATVLFSPGTEAYLEMPDGSKRPVPSLSIRLTEYTVGAGGPAAMPGELPGTSGYTYAVEVSADEAIAAGAGHARFTKPVKFYVDNFLEFPAGLIVPVASYDRDRAAWIPMDNGRVIRVLPGGGALAQVDITGDGAADGDAALAALGIDAVERAELARTYPEGASLWRMQTTHLTPFDLNYPAGPNPRPRGGQRPRRRPPPEECSGRRSGSVIECEGRVLGEKITVTGTSLALNYRSDRVLGRGNETVIPLTPDSLDGMTRVGVEVFVAGRRFYQEYPAAPRLSYTFRWDGLDAYGRRPLGQQTVRVRRTYTYPNYYLIPAADARSFGLACTQPRTGDRAGMVPCIIPASINERAREETTQADELTFEVNQWDSRQGTVAGWSLSDHHVYDPTSRRLYMGTGERRTASRMGAAIETIGGNGQSGYLAQNGQATAVPLEGAGPIAVAPDGTVYVAGWEDFWLARITRDGRVEHVAGGRFVRCTVAPCGDGGPLSGVRFAYGIEDLKFGPDGSLYIADGKLIRKLAPNGVTSLVAGNYVLNLNETYVHRDGGPAATTPIGYSWGVDVGPDGSVYFVESGNRVPVTRVRKVSPDGTIHTIAGGTAYPRNETAACRAEGIAATAACLDFATDVDVAPDGTVYILEPYNRLVKVTPQGTLVRVAGRRDRSCWGTEDGVSALETGLCGWRMELHRDGRIFFDDEEGPDFYADSVAWTGRMRGEARMRVIGLDGIVTTAFGGNGYCSSSGFQQCGDNGLARGARIGSIPGLAFGPDGAMYLGDIDTDRVRRVGLAFPGYDESTTFIASSEGSQVYELDGTGRHVRTRDARTGAVLRTFGYDAAGRITSVADENGQTTRVERDGAGRVQALVAPGGERTVLRENADGYLATITNPAGESVRVGYAGAGGLMTGLTDGRGSVHGYAYDDVGRLDRDTDAAGGFQVAAGFIDRNCTSPGECDEGSGTRVSTAAGRTTTYWSQRLDQGGVLREMASPTGLVTRMSSGDFGFNVLTTPDGMRTSSLLSHDPRFGMDASYASRAEIRTPGGLRLATTGSRRVVRGSLSDPFSLTTQVDSLVANGRATVTTYEAAARRTTIVSPAGRRTVMVSDVMGRPVEYQAAGGSTVLLQPDAAGALRELRHGARVWSFDYDAAGRLRSVTHPLGSTSFTYDAVGRVAGTVLAGGRELAYRWDAGGNRTGIRPPGRQMHSFAFDSAGRIAAYTPPAVDGVAGETRYRYDAEGQLLRVLRPEGDEVAYGYDAEGRTEEVRFGGARVRYGYHPTTGQLLSAASDARGSLSYTWDGALPLATTWSGAVAGSVSHAFNNDMRVSAQRVNGAHEVDFRYDADGLLTGVGALSFTRAPDSGRLTASQAGGVSTATAYDSLGNVAEIASRFGAQTLFGARYRRDAAGRVERLTETAGADSTVYTFGYDAAGRLATVHRDGVAHAAYEYDANGNRLRAVSAAGALDAEYDGQDRLRRLGDARYGYTAGGNLAWRATGADTTRYEYDAFGNLTHATLPDGTRVEYLVDPANRRVGRRVGGALVQGFLYGSGLNPVAELDGAGQVVSRFVYGSRGNVPDLVVKGGVTYRVVTDQLGSVRRVVNTVTGEVAQRLEYDAWGQVTLDTRPGFQPFGFAGGLVDGQVGLVRFGARDYDPRAGRWTTRDPVGFDGRDPNLYGYALGDPVNQVDPNGELPILAGIPLLWGAVEAGLAARDVADAVRTVADPCASGMD
ncbi:MAG TPA: RHS repeat-associated core domain-containing protein, partial [Longimicrobium sp.]